MPAPSGTPAPVRICGDCSLCCKVMKIHAFNKPRGVWCVHCKPGAGCSIYSEKPNECSAFYCRFLLDPSLDEKWKPSVSKIVLVFEVDGKRLAAYVDPQRPDAWKREPYYSALKSWARDAVAQKGQVIAVVNERTYMIFPDREVDLGIVGPDDWIMTGERRTPSGIRMEAFKLHKDDPRIQQLKQPGKS
jgi:hypothetical protein